MNAPEPKSDPHSIYAQPEAPGRARRAWRKPPSGRGVRKKRERLPWLMPMLVMLTAAAATLVTLAVLQTRPNDPRAAAAPAAPVVAPVAGAPPAVRAVEAEDVPAEVHRLISHATTIRDLKQQANMMQGRGLYSEAAELVRRQLSLTPHATELKALLGRLYLNGGRLHDARRMLIETLSADPSNLEARADLARALWAMGDYSGSLAIARWLIEAAPTYEEAHKLAAHACMSAGWNDQAVPFLRLALDLRPMDVEARNMLALAYLRQGAYARAIAHLQDLLKSGAADEATYFNLTAAFAQQRQTEDVVNMLFSSANVLGAERVAAWFSTEDFAPVRAAPMVESARMQLLNSLAQSTRTTLRSPKTDLGLGLMPMTELRTRRIELK
jgi:tetratricopeptide (TPR) repeat protein